MSCARFSRCTSTSTAWRLLQRTALAHFSRSRRIHRQQPQPQLQQSLRLLALLLLQSCALSLQRFLPRKTMLDFLFVVDDPMAFHDGNMRRNPSHYSFLKHAPRAVMKAVQDYGAGVYYNTLVRVPVPPSVLPLPSAPGAAASAAEHVHAPSTRLIKYGVISRERLKSDLTNWNTLYIAGRMHKPMHFLHCDDDMKQAARTNLQHALNISLLLLDGADAPKPTASGASNSLPALTSQSLLNTVCALSYSGDIRMGFAENPQKVSNIVRGSWSQLCALYEPLLQGSLLGQPFALRDKDGAPAVEAQPKRAACASRSPPHVSAAAHGFSWSRR